MVSDIKEITVQLSRPDFDRGQKGNISLGRRVTSGTGAENPHSVIVAVERLRQMERLVD